MLEAALHNHTKLAYKIIFLGGDVNTWKFADWSVKWLSTQIETAAYHGHIEMVRMLLKAGAGQSTQKVLERGAQNGNNRGGLQTRGIALHSPLSKHAYKGEFVEREILEDVHKITELLLEHGADPDVELPWRASCFTSPIWKTTREL